MTAQDRYSVGDFAKRYKLKEVELKRLCERFGIGSETIISRDEFRKLLDEVRKELSPGTNKEDTDTPSKPLKEDELKEEKKTSFARLAKERKLTPARVAVLKFASKWTDTTSLTYAEFQAAIDKHLLSKR